MSLSAFAERDFLHREDSFRYSVYTAEKKIYNCVRLKGTDGFVNGKEREC